MHEEKAILGERHGEICGFAWRKICWKRAVVYEVTVSFCRQGCIKGGSYSLSENVAGLVMAKFRGPDSRALQAAVSWTPGG